jgi:hypothetical protein
VFIADTLVFNRHARLSIVKVSQLGARGMRSLHSPALDADIEVFGIGVAFFGRHGARKKRASRQKWYMDV